MTSRSFGRGRIRKQIPTTLGRASLFNQGDPIDLSHVRKPIDTSVFGLRQVLELFETATDEVRRYIAYECDIIYECRICRSLFRSLANFILHKRSYCQEIYEPVYDSRRADMQDTSYEIGSDSSNEDEPVSDGIKTARNLSDVLKKLAEKRETIRLSEEIAYKELLPEESPINTAEGSDSGTRRNKVHLEKIDNSNSGVFQTMPDGSIASDLMKSEVMEIHSILNNNEAILRPDGKAFSFHTDREKPSAARPKLVCSVCGSKFSTKKTLRYHVKYKHNDTIMVYPCPECKDTFANAWCVFRHLYKVHRKTTAQIRKLRDVVHSSHIVKRQTADAVKETSLPGDLNSADRENQWLNNLEDDMDLQMCGGCGKRFERKAALHSHSQTCMKRMAVCNSIKKTSEEKSSSKQKPQTNVVLKGSRRRKPNILKKMVKPRDKPKDTANNNEDPGELNNEQSPEASVEKLQIEEVIFGNRQTSPSSDKPEEYREENRNEPIIILHSDDEDTIGFPSENEGGSQNEKEKSTEIDLTANRIEDIDTEVQHDLTNIAEIEHVNVDTLECISEPTDLVHEDVSDKIDNLAELNLLSAHENNISINECFLEDENINLNSPKDIFSNLELDLIVNGVSQNNPDFVVDLTEDGSPEINDTISDSFEMSPLVVSPNDLETSTPPLIIDEASEILLPEKVSPVQPLPKTARKRKRTIISLKTKSDCYVDWKLLQCKSCNTSFKTNDGLMEHMALHFDWFRFQCNKCKFVSYNNEILLAHLEKEHNISSAASELFTLRLSNGKALQLSSEFKSLEPGVLKEITDIDMMDKEDPVRRKLIMEVIFGSNATPTVAPDGKPNSTRSRNCMKTLDKDFVYDMDIVDTQIRHQAALENKVKPIRIIKNTDAEFKVINSSPSQQKKKKCC